MPYSGETRGGGISSNAFGLDQDPVGGSMLQILALEGKFGMDLS